MRGSMNQHCVYAIVSDGYSQTQYSRAHQRDGYINGDTIFGIIIKLCNVKKRTFFVSCILSRQKKHLSNLVSELLRRNA